MDALPAAFVAALGGEAAARFEALPDLASRLAAAVGAARAAHPGLALDAHELVVAVARRVAPDAEPERFFAHLHPADLALAVACARGDARALAAFDAAFGADIETAVRRFARPPLAADDLRQTLRAKLFSGEQPKIGDYGGQGFLQNWVRITAVRTFSDLARAAKRRRESPEDDLDALAADDDVELAYLKRRYRAEFKRAFEAAVRTLDARDRNLLRHSAVAGLSVDQIGAVYGVHRATAARWVQKARETLLAGTKSELAARLALESDELASLMALIESRLDLSIERVLGSRHEG